MNEVESPNNERKYKPQKIPAELTIATSRENRDVAMHRFSKQFRFFRHPSGCTAGANETALQTFTFITRDGNANCRISFALPNCAYGVGEPNDAHFRIYKKI
jgi:hypothetical protein